MRAVASQEAEALLDSVDELPCDVADSFSPPFLMCDTGEWATAQHKVVVFGQETLGWDYIWPDGSTSSRLLDGLDRTGRVEALVRNAEDFDLGRGYLNSPFWAAYQQIADRLEGGNRRAVLWGNLARCDTSPNEWQGYQGLASVWNALGYANLDALCEWQSDLLRAEIERSGCEAAIFFTGPNYDYLLERSLPDVKFEPLVQGVPARELAIVKSPALPELAFRLYHPAYMKRSGRWGHIDQVTDVIESMGKL